MSDLPGVDVLAGRLEGIEWRLNAASPGLWLEASAADGCCVLRSDPADNPYGIDVARRVSEADAVFIAHAKEDVRFLLWLARTLTADSQGAKDESEVL